MCTVWGLGRVTTDPNVLPQTSQSPHNKVSNTLPENTCTLLLTELVTPCVGAAKVILKGCWLRRGRCQHGLICIVWGCTWFFMDVCGLIILLHWFQLFSNGFIWICIDWCCMLLWSLALLMSSWAWCAQPVCCRRFWIPWFVEYVNSVCFQICI